MDLQKIGLIIKEKRTEQGLSQTQFAEALHVTRQAVSKWENQKSIPDPAMFEEIARLLHISISELLSEETGKSDEEERSLSAAAEEVPEKETAFSKRAVPVIVTVGLGLVLAIVLITVLSPNTGLNRWTVREFLVYFLPFFLFFCGLVLVIAALIGGTFRKRSYYLLIPGIMMMLYPGIVIAVML